MTRRTRIWWGVAAAFTIVNLLGAGFAAAPGEWIHAGVHVGPSVLGLYAMWRIPARARRQERATAILRDDRLGGDRLEQLQQSVDAVAIEVERLGEAQRFHDRLRAEREGTPR